MATQKLTIKKKLIDQGSARLEKQWELGIELGMLRVPKDAEKKFMTIEKLLNLALRRSLMALKR